MEIVNTHDGVVLEAHGGHAWTVGPNEGVETGAYYE